jgi:hypothetical protein
MSDPEEWVNIEEKDDEQWEFQLRVSSPVLFLYSLDEWYCVQPCSERVLLTLSNQFEPFVAPLLASSFEQVMGKQTANCSTTSVVLNCLH